MGLDKQVNLMGFVLKIYLDKNGKKSKKSIQLKFI